MTVASYVVVYGRKLPWSTRCFVSTFGLHVSSMRPLMDLWRLLPSGILGAEDIPTGPSDGWTSIAVRDWLGNLIAILPDTRRLYQAWIVDGRNALRNDDYFQESGQDMPPRLFGYVRVWGYTNSDEGDVWLFTTWSQQIEYGGDWLEFGFWPGHLPLGNP